MKKCFVFCHGFGFDKDFWLPLAPYFANEHTLYLDLGYFERPFNFQRPSNNVKLIGIGHSLGLFKLLSLNQEFEAVIGLNSFLNFTGKEPALKNKRKISLEKLKNHFITAPQITLKKFYEQCGASVDIQKLAYIDTQKMTSDLDLLLECATIPDATRALIIGSQNDIIVPPSLLQDNFDNNINIAIQIMETGYHALGNLEPKAVYQKIMCFLTDDR